MQVQKPIWKMYLTDETTPPSVKDLFSLFNEWIPGSQEIFIDVCDYSHIKKGPQVLLAGFYTDYIWDNTDGQWGLVSRFRQPLEGTPENILRQTWQGFLQRVEQFESWFSSRGVSPQLNKQKVVLSINDRSLYGNREQYEKELHEKVKDLFEHDVQLTSNSNPQELLNVKITSAESLVLAPA